MQQPEDQMCRSITLEGGLSVVGKEDACPGKGGIVSNQWGRRRLRLQG